jgi:XTP/dITP diphosphohydrolase
MMVTDILLASNNDHKRTELARLLPGVSLLTPADLGIDFDFEENGASFLENARGKALALYEKARRPVIADDSGLCVAALGGEPGIYSSRYGSGPDGTPLSTPARNALLLDRMRGVADRAAFFVCCCVCILGEARYVIAQETVHGSITDAPRGVNGFGYDPLFLPRGGRRTIAELPDTEKDAISHRGRAARRILAALHAED